MENEVLINTPVQFLGSVCGIELKPYHAEGIDSTKQIQLKKEIFEILKKSLGSNVFSIDISPENLLRYKDGTYSSMLKKMNNKYIQKHVGFENIDLINVADEIYKQVVTNMGLSIIPQLCNEVLMRYSEIQRQMNLIYDNQINEHFANIFSFKMFFDEIKKSIKRIMTTPDLRTSYLNKVVDIKQQIYKEIIFFKLCINTVIRNSGQNIDIPQYTPNYCLFLMFLIDLYENNLELEYILGGDYTIDQSYIYEESNNLNEEINILLSNLANTLNINYSSFFDFSNGPYIKRLVEFCVNSKKASKRHQKNLQKELVSFLKDSKIVSDYIPNTTFNIDENVTAEQIKRARQLLEQESKDITFDNDEEENFTF